MFFGSKSVTQENHLREIVKQVGESSQGKYLKLDKISWKLPFSQLYPQFKSVTPITTQEQFKQRLRQILAEPVDDWQQTLARPNLVSQQTPNTMIDDEGHEIALLETTMKTLQRLDRDFWQLIFKQGNNQGWFLEVFDSPPPPAGQQSGDLMRWLATQREQRYKRMFYDADTALAEVGNSRYQQLHAYVKIMKELGENVRTLAISPAALSDIAFLHSQFLRRDALLHELCPNLKCIVYHGTPSSRYRHELNHYCQGLDILTWERDLMLPGILSWQDDVNLRDRLHIPAENPFFYEFVPVEDVLPDGSLKRQYRRQHAGEITEGQTYLLAVSTPAGLLAHNTGELVKIVSTEPLRWRRLGSAAYLNGFAQALPMHEVDSLMRDLNEALGSFNLVVRSYMLGDDLTARKPLALLEVNVPLRNLREDVLQSIANKLHTELALRVPRYAEAFTKANINPLEVTFVPRGTTVQHVNSKTVHPLDYTSGAEQIKKLIGHAADSVTLTASGGIG